MNLRDLQNKKIALLGLGVENYALLKYLLAHKVKAQFTVCDQRNVESLGEKFLELNRFANVFWQLGQEFNKKLDRYDILFRSPGWPLHCPGIVEAKKLNVEIIVTSAMQLFFDLCPTKNIIGVTGTKGKGTTSSLIYAMLKSAKKQVYLGGNIGIAPFAFLPKLKKADFVVLELSSFQLEDLSASSHIAVMTNFTPEHLAPADPNNPNFHQSLKGYWQSKLSITKQQTEKDFLVVNERLKLRIKNYELSKSKIKAKKIFFDQSVLPSSLPGEHNKENIAAAEAVAKILKINEATVARAVKNFKGLEHRIEPVAENKGVKYYDDSFATTPESAIIALKSFNNPIILLAGGADKGADFKSLAKEITKRVKFVVLFKGAATPRLKKSLLAAGFKTKNIKIAHSMSEAVKLAKAQAQAGDIVLLSTACASFGLFKNYKQRGDLFKQAVKEL